MSDHSVGVLLIDRSGTRLCVWVALRAVAERLQPFEYLRALRYITTISATRGGNPKKIFGSPLAFSFGGANSWGTAQSPRLRTLRSRVSAGEPGTWSWVGDVDSYQDHRNARASEP